MSAELRKGLEEAAKGYAIERMGNQYPAVDSEYRRRSLVTHDNFALEEAYAAGAEWADAHRWHKTSEELPEVPEKKTYIKVLTTWPSGNGFHFFVLYYHKDFGFSKYKHYQNVYYKDQKEFPEYWMYIPKVEKD